MIFLAVFFRWIWLSLRRVPQSWNLVYFQSYFTPFSTHSGTSLSNIFRISTPFSTKWCHVCQHHTRRKSALLRNINVTLWVAPDFVLFCRLDWRDVTYLFIFKSWFLQINLVIWKQSHFKRRIKFYNSITAI